MNYKNVLGFADLVGNLFAILKENSLDVNTITFKQIDIFKKLIEEEADKNNINVLFDLSIYWTIRFFNNNHDFKNIDDDNIVLSEGLTLVHLIYHYKSSLPVDVYKLLSNEDFKNKVIETMGYEVNDTKTTLDIDHYINILKMLINNYAANMEFEKCIELRNRLYDLNHIKSVMDNINNNKELKLKK